MSEEVNTTNCRFYESKYPEVEDLVMVNVKEIADMGAYVKLLEYDGVEGMILLSELSRRRIRSIQKLIKVGRNEVVVVLRVDKDKGYIDLSKRRVSAEDIVKCEEKYNKSKAVHSILRHVAEKHKYSLEKLYENVGWPLSRKYGHAYEAFKQAITTPEEVFAGTEIPSPEIFDELILQISRRLTPNPIKCRTDIELTCFGYEGIDAIKTALLAGELFDSEKTPLKIRLVAAPMFVMHCTSIDKQLAIDTLHAATNKMREIITASDGNLNVVMEPKAVTASEESELEKQLQGELEDSEEESDEDFD
ncbi:nucleic acid-binding protein [Nadsonia fulvescens var. elongata DSM 6958]|uniref:Nucleic acid-binding protein n=1 Tax=Nadsonia fulvescens var. elongata DSM 6958 TaxID=857566 RepID=A0A1E3PLG5_9ASCO|nr:nucleic acid-binding protein [Nadsonia fulvescens var. elongata DSM 6958]